MTDHITNRTAVYGPVRTVVWERLGRKDRPYPDPAFQLWEGVTPSIASPGGRLNAISHAYCTPFAV